MKPTLLIYLFTLCFMVACKDKQPIDQYGKTDSEKLVQSAINERSTTKRLVKKLFAIGDSLQVTNLNNFKYFGSFFKGRAIYYHNYTDTIYHGKSVKGSDLLLCFFDNQIARMRYQVDRDITTELMMKHGSFRIKPLDSLSKVVVNSREILIKTDNMVALHEDLRNYELTWQKPDKQIVFRRNENFESLESFVYEERIPDYKESMIYLTKY